MNIFIFQPSWSDIDFQGRGIGSFTKKSHNMWYMAVPHLTPPSRPFILPSSYLTLLSLLPHMEKLLILSVPFRLLLFTPIRPLPFVKVGLLLASSSTISLSLNMMAVWAPLPSLTDTAVDVTAPAEAELWCHREFWLFVYSHFEDSPATCAFLRVCVGKEDFDWSGLWGQGRMAAPPLLYIDR